MHVSYAAMIQQAVLLVSRGYYFYSTWTVKEKNRYEQADTRINKIYPETNLSKWQKSRLKKAKNHAKLAYYRCNGICLLLATDGASEFFKREKWQDVRKNSLTFSEFTIFRSERKVNVKLTREALKELEGEVEEHALSQNAVNFLGYLNDYLDNFREFLYGGVRKQLFAMLKRVNEARNGRGFSRVQIRIPNRKPVKLMPTGGGLCEPVNEGDEPMPASSQGNW
jgi:hypothetical protein